MTYGVLIHASPFAKAECSRWRADAATARYPHRPCGATERSTQKTAHEELFSLMRTLILHFEQWQNNGRRVRSMVRRVAKQFLQLQCKAWRSCRWARCLRSRSTVLLAPREGARAHGQAALLNIYCSRSPINALRRT